jgi:hypothetical protein
MFRAPPPELAKFRRKKAGIEKCRPFWSVADE